MDIATSNTERQLGPNQSGDNDSVPVRRIYIAPLNRNMDDEIRRYFERFGAVESVEIRIKAEPRYGFVLFKSTDAAQSALIDSKHYIANYPVNVKAADLCHQPDFESSLNKDPPDQDSPSNILNALNDDCLREVLHRLDLLNLSSAANVCTRYNLIAKEVFNCKYKHCDLSFNSGFYDQPEKAEMVLSNFGSSIESLRVESGNISDSWEHALYVINQHCTQLKKLCLERFQFFDGVETIYPIFAKLEGLHLAWCMGGMMPNNFLANCVELRTLRVKDCNYNGCIIQQHFKKIEEAHLVNFQFKDSEFNIFITLNPTLTKLSVVDCEVRSTETFRYIGQNLQNLQELEFHEEFTQTETFQTDILSLAHLKSLNKLKLHFNSKLISPLMRAMATNETPIEHLKIHAGEIDAESIESLSKLKLIQILELSDVEGSVTNEHLIELAKELPQLQQLYLKGATIELTTIGLKKMLPHASNLSLLHLKSIDNVTIDADDYKAMLKIVQNRTENTKLKIELTSGGGGKVEVPDDILSQNRNFLDINEEIEEEEDGFDGISNDSNDLFDDDSFGDNDEYGSDDYDIDLDGLHDDEDEGAVALIDGRRYYLG